MHYHGLVVFLLCLSVHTLSFVQILSLSPMMVVYIFANPVYTTDLSKHFHIICRYSCVIDTGCSLFSLTITKWFLPMACPGLLDTTTKHIYRGKHIRGTSCCLNIWLKNILCQTWSSITSRRTESSCSKLNGSQCFIIIVWKSYIRIFGYLILSRSEYICSSTRIHIGCRIQDSQCFAGAYFPAFHITAPDITRKEIIRKVYSPNQTFLPPFIFSLLDDLMELHRILTLNKAFYFKICPFLC